MSAAILLIAHGSRRPAANQDLVQLAVMLRPKVPGKIVEVAYLELAEPTIPEGLEKCRQSGAREIDMLPWFLSAGSHVTDDLSRFRDQFASEHPGLTVTLRPPVGLHPLMTDILLARLGERL
ncbi:Sirohydrochlorin cobaltochelatase [Caulifigura coniformis]|uniref:Sirohydrochlorin cobaltochelatase n=1 Tax=Caulifigura coniformis TaxID=2527983 RepID=A0A517S936_9PLAN|nr:CbiX/SirB N-terminal domain-containing protein [Caulifigura coniformis]QDT52647.1 Sirohydrochlorin cobaltochelatase [Caulifigura coniformis]